MDLTIRPALEHDAEAIAAIYNQSVIGSTASFDTVEHTADDRAMWLATHGLRHPVIVAETGGLVVAWGCLSPWNVRAAYADTVEITVYVDEGHARLGIGRTMDLELISLARELGHHAVIAQISGENAASIALVESLGFEHAGTLREVGCKFGRLLDVALYELLL